MLKRPRLALPADAPAGLHGEHVAAPTVPVDVLDPPRPAGEEQQPGALHAGDQGQRMDGADFGSAMQDNELRIRSEHAREVSEMPMPVPLLGFGPDEEEPTIDIKVAGGEQVLDSVTRTGGIAEAGHTLPPRGDVRAGNSAFLEGQGEHLVGDHVRRVWRGPDGFDEPARPQQQQSQRPQQRVLPCRQEQAVARRSRPAAGPAQALQEAGDRVGGVDLDHPV
jgi:hypothetical protein